MRKSLYILGDLIDEDIIFLAREGELLHFSDNEIMIRAGEAISALFFVTHGEFEVISTTGERIAKLGIGDVVGEMSFVESQPPDVTVIAQGNCRVLAVNRELLLTELDRQPDFAARFYKALAAFLSDRLRTITPGGVEGELDERLLDIVHIAGDRLRRLIDMLESR